MPRITIDVDSTAGSRIGRATAVGHSIFARTHHADGWPVGWGHILDTRDQQGRLLPALVLMIEPALPGLVHAWPIGLIQIEDHRPTHTSAHSRTRSIVACVEEAAPFVDLIDLADPTGWHAEADDWLAALRHLQPQVPRHARAHGGRGEADAHIAAASRPGQPPQDEPATPIVPFTARIPR